MLYRANELPGVQRKKYVKTTGESFKNTESMVDADDVNGATSRQDLLRTLPKALKDDDLGLLEAYPHLISKQVLTKSINRAGIAPSTLILSEAGHASQVPVHASKPRSSESAMTPAAKNTLRSTKHGRDKVRQANTVAHPTCSKSNALRVHGLSSRDASKGITVRSSGIVHIGAVPINALRRPDASIRKPSKNALQPPVSPRPLAYALRDVLSARSSMPSATESFQDEAQTDTAPGNVKDTEFRSPAVLRVRQDTVILLRADHPNQDLLLREHCQCYPRAVMSMLMCFGLRANQRRASHSPDPPRIHLGCAPSLRHRRSHPSTCSTILTQLLIEICPPRSTPIARARLLDVGFPPQA